MNETIMTALGQTGAFAAIAIAGFGSALGTGAAGAAAIGAWKKCYAQNKPAPFQLAVLAGAPLSQTIYGMIIMFLALVSFKQPEQWPFFLIMGIISGLAMGASAWMQGRAGAGACHAFADTEKGFTNYLMALGIIETVAIFVMAFGIVIMAMVGGYSTPFSIKVAEYQSGEGQEAKNVIIQEAKQESQLLAKIPQPIDPKLTPAIIIDSQYNDSINIDVYECDDDGNLRYNSKLIGTALIKNGVNKLYLSEIKYTGKKSLEPGKYLFEISKDKTTARVLVEVEGKDSGN